MFNAADTPVQHGTARQLGASRILLIIVLTLFLLFHAALAFLITVLAGPHLLPLVKPLTKFTLAAMSLVAVLRRSDLLLLLASTLLAFLSLTWWLELAPPYHNWVHFRLEVLPSLLVELLAIIVFAVALAVRRSTEDLQGANTPP